MHWANINTYLYNNNFLFSLPSEVKLSKALLYNHVLFGSPRGTYAAARVLEEIYDPNKYPEHVISEEE